MSEILIWFLVWLVLFLPACTYIGVKTYFRLRERLRREAELAKAPQADPYMRSMPSTSWDRIGERLRSAPVYGSGLGGGSSSHGDMGLMHGFILGSMMNSGSSGSHHDAPSYSGGGGSFDGGGASSSWSDSSSSSSSCSSYSSSSDSGSSSSSCSTD